MENMLKCTCGQVPRVSDHEGSAIHISCRCGMQLWGAKAHFTSVEAAVAEWNSRHAAVAKLSADFESTVEYMNEGCICGRAPNPKHTIDARLQTKVRK